MIEYTISWVLTTLAVIQAANSGEKRPQFTVEPPARVLWPATRGAHATCKAAGHPSPEVYWVTNDGQILTTIPGLRHILSDGRLVVGARRSLMDAGSGGSAILRCKAINRAGTILSRPVMLQPVEDNVLSHNVRQLSPAKIGGSVILKCEVSLQVGLVDITWLQDGLPLASGYMGSDSRWVSGAGGLLLGLDLIQVDIQAEYSCVALETPSPTLRLTTDDSSWLENIELNAIEAQVGDTVILPCILRHVTAHTVIWQRQDAGGAWITTGEGTIRGHALVFSNARTQHATRYACSAGPEGSPRFMTRLTIYEPLAVTVTPNPLMLGTGGSGHFNCSVHGGRGGGITISWQHEGRPLHAPQAKLSLGPVRSHHAGLYQCTAHDHSDSAVAGAELVIADRPPRLVSTFSEAVTRIGQNIALKCSATGVPSPRIIWTLDDRPLPAVPDKYTVTTRAENILGNGEGTIVSTLSVTIKTSEEGGRYGCNATNSRGSHAHHARLNVFGPPNIRYLPAIHVKSDTDVVLNCPYSGYPIKEVIWRREDGSPMDASLEPGDERGILRINSIRGSAAGSYTCEVQADSGEIARRTVRVEVHKPPKIMPFQFPEELEVGSSTQATCSLVSGDKPIQFSWLKDNLPIPSILKTEQKNMDFFSLLIIQELTSSHSGEYTCRATNDFGSVSHTAHLIVKESPTWVWRAQNTSVSAGAALLLPCSAKGQPSPRISWEYSSDGDNWRHVMWSQAEAADTGDSILSDGTIWLTAASPDHEGWYRCTARLQHSFLQHSFYLDVREPPKLTRSGGGGETRWVVRGSAARLTCTIKGEPEIHFHWTYDSRPLTLHGSGISESRDVSNGVMTSEITIAHAGPEHAGEYRCLARNLYGSDEVLFRLFVKERPSMPEEVRISEVWSRRARVTWRVARGALVSHYTLQYRALNRDYSIAPLDAPLPALLDTWDTPDFVNLTLTNSDLLHVASEGPTRAGAAVAGLMPDTRYALRLAAFNDVGPSPYTTPLHFTTREEAPGGIPRDITVRALKSRELHVTWQPPGRETWHGTLLGYTIRWWEISEDGKGSNDGPGSESGASADATSTTIRGLKAATRYGVTVRAYNAAGNGPVSPPHYRHTLESAPSGGPESLTCISSGSTSLRVSWKPPPADVRGGLITHYTLQYTRRDADPLNPNQDAFLRVQGEETTVPRLTPYAEYEIRVRAHNAAGDGPLSPSQMCRTDEDVPSAPGGMKLIALGERSLRASWLPPPEPNGRLTHYNLYVKDLSGSQEPNVTRVNACSEGDSSIECMRPLRGLRAGRTYEAWVRAATGAGEGPPSAVATCQTSALAPAKISSFGGLLVGAAGGSLTLRCVVGGAPPPAKRWLKGRSSLHSRPPFHLDGDALILRGLELSHADNYTCVAENPHGSDSVTWRVIVLRPPPPPSLALIEARPRELELDLRPTQRTHGHALSKTYTVHWRLSSLEGEWRVQPASPGPITLAGLRCGSAYRAYGSAGGPPGSEISVRTSGGPPTAPPDSRWIKANTTHASFDTTAWGDGGCGPVILKMEWAGSGVAGARDIPVGGDVILGGVSDTILPIAIPTEMELLKRFSKHVNRQTLYTGLTAGSRYRIAARASNEAGWTREVYEFTTLPSEGGFAEEVDAPFPATAGELALLLALCAALSLAALTILAILLRRKRSDGAAARVATNSEKPACGTYRAPLHQAPKLPPDPPDVYEISPYATFAGPGSVGASSRAYTLQLRALARHDDESAPPAHVPCCDEESCVDACDGQRRRRRRRHYCPDHGCSQDSGS